MNSVKKFIEAVAYLDIGAGGYLDLGSDLPDERLLSLPKGRHALGIIGTYGIDGYVPAAPCIDASHSGALPTLPDDFSESKDWRAGSYGERVEWLMDTVRSQREHIAALLDNH